MNSGYRGNKVASVSSIILINIVKLFAIHCLKYTKEYSQFILHDHLTDYLHTIIIVFQDMVSKSGAHNAIIPTGHETAA